MGAPQWTKEGRDRGTGNKLTNIWQASMDSSSKLTIEDRGRAQGNKLTTEHWLAWAAQNITESRREGAGACIHRTKGRGEVAGQQADYRGLVIMGSIRKLTMECWPDRVEEC